MYKVNALQNLNQWTNLFPWWLKWKFLNVSFFLMPKYANYLIRILLICIDTLIFWQNCFNFVTIVSLSVVIKVVMCYITYWKWTKNKYRQQRLSASNMEAFHALILLLQELKHVDMISGHNVLINLWIWQMNQ